MKSNILNILLVHAICGIAFVACKKSDPAPKSNGTVTPTPVVSLMDTICRKWVVKTATHNGSNDPSSEGLKLDISSDGTYLLYSTQYIGTWEFIDNKSKVLLDKASSTYKTTWTIVQLSSKRLEVKFKSPFTGGDAVWIMNSY